MEAAERETLLKRFVPDEDKGVGRRTMAATEPAAGGGPGLFRRAASRLSDPAVRTTVAVAGGDGSAFGSAPGSAVAPAATPGSAFGSAVKKAAMMGKIAAAFNFSKSEGKRGSIGLREVSSRTSISSMGGADADPNKEASSPATERRRSSLLFNHEEDDHVSDEELLQRAVKAFKLASQVPDGEDRQHAEIMLNGPLQEVLEVADELVQACGSNFHVKRLVRGLTLKAVTESQSGLRQHVKQLEEQVRSLQVKATQSTRDYLQEVSLLRERCRKVEEGKVEFGKDERYFWDPADYLDAEAKSLIQDIVVEKLKTLLTGDQRTTLNAFSKDREKMAGQLKRLEELAEQAEEQNRGYQDLEKTLTMKEQRIRELEKEMTDKEYQAKKSAGIADKATLELQQARASYEDAAERIRALEANLRKMAEDHARQMAEFQGGQDSRSDSDGEKGKLGADGMPLSMTDAFAKRRIDQFERRMKKNDPWPDFTVMTFDDVVDEYMPQLGLATDMPGIPQANDMFNALIRTLRRNYIAEQSRLSNEMNLAIERMNHMLQVERNKLMAVEEELEAEKDKYNGLERAHGEEMQKIMSQYTALRDEYTKLRELAIESGNVQNFQALKKQLEALQVKYNVVQQMLDEAQLEKKELQEALRLQEQACKAKDVDIQQQIQVNNDLEEELIASKCSMLHPSRVAVLRSEIRDLQHEHVASLATTQTLQAALDYLRAELQKLSGRSRDDDFQEQIAFILATTDRSVFSRLYEDALRRIMELARQIGCMRLSPHSSEGIGYGREMQRSTSAPVLTDLHGCLVLNAKDLAEKMAQPLIPPGVCAQAFPPRQPSQPIKSPAWLKRAARHHLGVDGDLVDVAVRRCDETPISRQSTTPGASPPPWTPSPGAQFRGQRNWDDGSRPSTPNMGTRFQGSRPNTAHSFSRAVPPTPLGGARPVRPLSSPGVGGRNRRSGPNARFPAPDMQVQPQRPRTAQSALRQSY